MAAIENFASYKFVDSDGILRDKVVRVGKDLEESWFDGSSFGFCPTEKSDLLLVPDMTTAFKDPIRGMRSVFCFLRNPDGSELDTDFRTQAHRALNVDEQTKGALFGVEPEFFIMQKTQPGEIVPVGVSSLAELKNVKQGEWYGSLPPTDCFHHIRTDIVEKMTDAGFNVEGVHHEVAPGQAEVSWKCDNVLRTADNMVLFKYIVSAVCATHGLRASFEAKPFQELNGNGCHVHQSLPAMTDKVNGEAAVMAYAQGLVDNYDALREVCCVGTTSAQRLVPGFEAPTRDNNGIGLHNRTKTIRIPGNGGRLEYRLPDPSMNPYVSLVKMLEFGRAAVEKKLGV